jgi:type IV pilus assembly protein PilQ
MKIQMFVVVMSFVFYPCIAISEVANGMVDSTSIAVGKRIELFEVHDADIHSVLRQLSTYSGVDIVAGDAVKGIVSLSVSNKTWKEILNIICRIQNLASINEGSYVYVLNAEEYSQRNVDKKTTAQSQLETSPLRREALKINHLSAKEIATPIEGLLSVRGKLTVVEHTNALIILDTDENINQIKQMISQLDIETPQISISCKIIEVSSGAVQRRGSHWGSSDLNEGVEVTHIPAKSNIVTDALERLSYGVLNAEKFSIALEYLFNDNNAEVVAQPQITTVDNKEARIFMGQQISIPYVDEAGNTVYTQLNAGTELIVKPHISGNGRILLELSPKKESYTLQSGYPIINKQSATTNVVVSNGETVVIA